MKKVSKLLATLLAVIIFTSAFAVAPSAISPSSSAKEMLDYYEKCLIETSATETIVKTRATGISDKVADVSSLTSYDASLTLDYYEWEDVHDSWDKIHYVYCDPYEDHYVNGRSVFVDVFSIKRDIRRKDLTFKSAKLVESSNGDKTITFVYHQSFDSGNTNVITYKVVIGKNEYIKSFSVKQKMNGTYLSYFDKPFKISMITDELFVFDYATVDVESISLSKEKVKINLDEETTIKPVVKPNDATYKGVYAESADEDIATCYVDDDGNVCIQAVGKGKTTISVYTYDGDYVADCEVTVKEPISLGVFSGIFGGLLALILDLFNIFI